MVCDWSAFGVRWCWKQIDLNFFVIFIFFKFFCRWYNIEWKVIIFSVSWTAFWGWVFCLCCSECFEFWKKNFFWCRYNAAYTERANTLFQTNQIVVLLPQLLSQARRQQIVSNINADVVLLSPSRTPLHVAVLAGCVGQFKQARQVDVCFFYFFEKIWK